jgi:hypothetical protein
MLLSSKSILALSSFLNINRIVHPKKNAHVTLTGNSKSLLKKKASRASIAKINE